MAVIAPAAAELASAVVVLTPPPGRADVLPEVPKLPPKQVASFTLTSASLAALTARGSLSTSVVRRSVERTIADASSCARAAGALSERAAETVTATFVIGEQRRATSIAAAGSRVLAGCVERALAGVRTADAPDVGSVWVSLEIRFTQGSS